MRIDVLRKSIIALAWCGLVNVGRADEGDRRDVHSYSRPDQVRIEHAQLSLLADFEKKTLRGGVTWTFERRPGAPDDAPLVLDTRGLTITSVKVGPKDEDPNQPADFKLGESDPILGAPLTIQLPAGAGRVSIEYETSPDASALQWVEPAGTASKAKPFLFSQAQAIHARSFVPCQDTPGVRITYDASVLVPHGLKAVMAAEQVGMPDRMDFLGMSRHRFTMPHPIPSYLIALAVGDLEFREIGPRTGVWAEPSVVEKAAWEFADTEKMLIEAEKLFGPYRWERYDILVLPPSFPFGGMENPRLTFATPTVLAGDRSQVDLIAHEMAHSWSGNLVTNATWRDFWLNEGFTVYLQRRIVEAVYGPERAAMEEVLGHGELTDAVAKLPPNETVLHIDLSGRDPDDGVTAVPYEKGALFLKALERKVGRDRLTKFLRGYFDHFAFRSITTADFESYLKSDLFDGAAPPLDLNAWLHSPGIPEGAPVPNSERFHEIEAQAKDWLVGRIGSKALGAEKWSTWEWLQFLRSLPDDLPADRLADLDETYHLTDTGNAEIATQWLLMAIRAEYEVAYPRLERFLTSVGRRKFLMPLYEALIQTDKGRERARAIFEKARSGYHPIAVDSVERLLETRKTEKNNP
jgi:leukotriene-A4 hydrolase